ncbi:MAG TPA: bifunctional 4-hydroxy-2-oxoglutarate aldolase/2-dehydro-3-deoxy-phosphogluconate aldolase [Gaiellaceae bacterium]|jgi:2-dehydro-3-deoxyphosphogluconate aldolase/(4S)-4-hydroxy-2-oxoglutarate aldolase|nr:bifunctional 4-hydroxy-2-oxoglutarate aldolase/2-dehydro-3-deoxy-phosphogluconate aldolase [Gaiellaceae bacterium]
MSAIDRIRSERLVAILRRVDDLDARVAALADAGVGVIEITLDDPDALGAIERARGRGDVTVLAGTVRRAEQVDAAVAAGAEAVVGPGLVGSVVERAAELGVPAIPGALTPTEIEAAWAAGAALVKLFPGVLGGPRYVRDVLAPLADVPLLVTGGVDAQNALAFLDAGAVAVGVGSALDDPDEARRVVAALR